MPINTPTVAEHEQTLGKRVLPHLVFNECGQAIDALVEVDGVPAKKHLGTVVA